ncbi:MAG: ATP-binding cassette domain-containing protein [Thermodesulfobacteriota bacterium]
MRNKSAITVEGLTKYYGNFLAVDHVNFNVNNGELFGFLGPNGAGKTTTVRILTGIIKAEEGRAVVMGFPAGSLQAKQLSGVVPEQVNAYIDLSAWNNLMLMAELYRVRISEARSRAEVLLQEVGLYEKKDNPVKTFSLGMRKRLILCLALISEPKVLFLDEPTSGLDVQSTRLIRGTLRKLRKERMTIFLTTHNMDEASELCDRVAIINHGKLVAIDTPERLRIGAGRFHVVEIGFEKPVALETLSKLPNADKVEGAGNKVRIYTENPCNLVASVVDLTRSHSLKMVNLNVETPSLEEAFIRLTQEIGHER